MTGRLVRIEITTLTRPFFLLSFRVSTWGFREQALSRAQRKSLHCRLRFHRFLIVITVHISQQPKGNPEWQDKVRVHNDRWQTQIRIKWALFVISLEYCWHSFKLFHDLKPLHLGQNFEFWFGLSYPVGHQSLSRLRYDASGNGRRPTHLRWKPLLRLNGNRKPRMISLLAPKVLACRDSQGIDQVKRQENALASLSLPSTLSLNLPLFLFVPVSK